MRLWVIPSGYVKIAIENDHIEIVDFPIKHGGSFHRFLYVYQRGFLPLSIKTAFISGSGRLHSFGDRGRGWMGWMGR